MVFSSLTFIFAFLPSFFLCYSIAGKLWGIKGNNVVLLAFSLVFYAWGEPVYVLLMIASITINYYCAVLIENFSNNDRTGYSKTIFIISIVVNLGMLAVFKYAGLIISTCNRLLNLSLTVPEIALPIGISFYTFQTMSYTIDVYKGRVKAQKNILNLGAYVSMFPQLIAGPIVRYETIAEQLEDRNPTTSDVSYGIRRFIIGLGKKTLIANIMASTADALFSYSASEIGMIGSWTAILAFTLQIYFDFSGYSDMAIGLGRIMGFTYLENFNDPYTSSSVTEFWRRWHISLSTFFRDYIYIPLGGNRVSVPRWLLNIFIVWFLTGLWHGASWNFVLWGLYFGVLLVIEKFLLKKILDRHKILGHIWTVICFIYGWVLFSRETVSEIADFTKALLGQYGIYGNGSTNAITILQQSDFNTIFIIAFAAGIIFSTGIAGKTRKILLDDGTGIKRTLSDSVLLLVLILCVIRLLLGSYNPFIYFRF